MANSSKKKSGLQRGESKAAFLFCTPAVVLALVFIILPFAMSVVYSFTNKQLIPKVGMETAFVGLKNYIEIFTSKVTVLSFKNTFLYALIVVPSVLVIGTVLAVFVNQKIKGVQVFRLIYFSPQVVTMTVVAVIWAFIFSSKSSGLLNSFLGLLHIAPQKWLQDQHLALPCLAIMYIWQNLGMQMLIILSGLQYISEELYEAAEIDGCTTFEKFIYITVPGLKNTLVYVLVSVIINSLKVFTQVYVLTNGGPSNATTTVVFQLYKAGFVNGQVGYSSTIAVTFFMLVMVISILQNKFAKED